MTQIRCFEASDAHGQVSANRVAFGSILASLASLSRVTGPPHRLSRWQEDLASLRRSVTVFPLLRFWNENIFPTLSIRIRTLSMKIKTFFCFFPPIALSEDAGSLPRFVEKVPNITVTVGRDALLPCTVEQLKSYKVAWVQVDTQTILTIHKQVITRNPRISLLHNDHRTWHLELKNVQESDRGWYMCQVNTDPMESQKGYVDVVVPPDIIDRESSGDLTVREGQDVNLTCRAKGHPTPNIVWRREDNQKIVLDAEKTDMGAMGGAALPVGGRDGLADGVVGAASVVEGETLTMKKVSRLQMGSYLCIASNGIPPSISKRTHLRVQFPPVAWVPQQLEGAYVGQELTIECHTEAFPKSINYWTNTKGDMIVAGEMDVGVQGRWSGFC
ncbi:lachesin [Penaeus vannamei]|uniref:lachesin n=1 Tax=Penaeus vannamei TaxID=6689 RepID=UPI00387F557B